MVDGNGHAQINLEDYVSDKDNPNDVTISDTTSTPITLVQISKLGGSEKDVIRFDLSTFDDSFAIEISDQSSNDIIMFDGAHTYTDNGDGTHSISYYGTDSLLHYIVLTPGDAQVEPYYAPDDIIEGEDGAELMGDGYTDTQGDQIGSGDGDANDEIIGGSGSDTINAGAGNDTIAGDYADLIGRFSTQMPDNAYTGTPSGPAPGAEVDTFTIDNLLIDNNGHVKVEVDQFATKEDAKDVTIAHGGTEAITLIEISKGGGNDGEADVFRFDLSAFDDDFTVTLVDEDALDSLVFEGVHTVTNNGDGTFELSYFGSDSALHTVNVDPDTAQVEFYVSPSSPYFFDDVIDGGDGDDLIDAGFGDDDVLGGDGGDTINGGDGSDTIDGGAGADDIIGDRTAQVDGLADKLEYSFAQNATGGTATHYGEQGTGGVDDQLLFIDGDVGTEARYHQDDIVEYSFGQ